MIVSEFVPTMTVMMFLMRNMELENRCILSSGMQFPACLRRCRWWFLLSVPVIETFWLEKKRTKRDRVSLVIFSLAFSSSSLRLDLGGCIYSGGGYDCSSVTNFYLITV